MERDALRTDDAAIIRMRAKALNGAGWIAVFQGDYAGAKALLEEGLALYRGLEDKDGVASCLATLGFAATLGQRDLASVPALLDEAMRLKPELTDTRTVANLFIFAGLVSISEGALEQAIASYEEGLALYSEVRDTLGVSMCLTVLGLVEMARANHTRAVRLIQENLRVARESDDKRSIYFSFLVLAGVAFGSAKLARTARLWGAAEAIREPFGIYLSPLTRILINYEERLAAARDQLGEAAFARVWAEGKAMTQERAIEYALTEEPAPAPIPVPGEPPASLTRREEEVAVLVARGLTNRRIAQELSISERTAATHIGRILKKLNLRSREQVAAQVAGDRRNGENRATY